MENTSGTRPERPEITAQTKLDELLREYPFLQEFLRRRAPRFKALSNPVMRKTIGKVATLEQVASFGGVPLAQLLAEVAAEVKARTGRDVSIRRGDGVPAAPIEDPEARMEALKGIIRDLHRGVEMGTLKARFDALIRDVDGAEVARMEQKLIEEGMPREEVKHLCDVHVGVFQESLDRGRPPQVPAGHPVHTFMRENRAAEDLLARIEQSLRAVGDPPREQAFQEQRAGLTALVEELGAIDRHYLRKENQLFPLLEARGMSGPSGVMWAIHDDVRGMLKNTRSGLAAGQAADTVAVLAALDRTVRDMIYKEERILFPMALEALSAEDWVRVRRGEDEIGYAWVEPEAGSEEPEAGREHASGTGGRQGEAIELDTGRLTAEQINLILTHLPVDISFIDEQDEVVYYSQTPERIFPRSPGVIGRRVHNCHPPKSVPVVQKILDAFRAGTKDVAEFHLEMAGRFIHIRYYAVRDREGRYRGTLEVSQDVTGIRGLKGEKRLLDWE